jgi:radical SAM-linked protein
MVAESPKMLSAASAEAEVPASPVPPIRQKYRLRFRKEGDLRLVSHHDLMHVFERMLRRAQIPIAHTQGFHPQPRMVFALSLALGITGGNEVLELELTEALDPENLQARLAEQAPLGLTFSSVRRLEGKSSPLVRRAFYRLPLMLDHESITPSAAYQSPDAWTALLRVLPERCRDLLAQSHLWVERSRPQPRKIDIRPYLSELKVSGQNLEIAVWVTPTGTARSEEYARLLGLEALLDAGAFFERTDLEMMDEVSAPLPEMMINTEETAPILDEELSRKPDSAPAPKPAARPTALVSGPMEFDS